jgi:hypothetical protein
VNEPFWRSAKHIELGPIPVDAFASFVTERFAGTGKKAPPPVVDAVLEVTHGHPYGTQELCYALWEGLRPGATARPADLDRALEAVLRSENAHFSRIWEKAPPPVVDAVLEVTHGHPYGTQELCYALWEETPARGSATVDRLAAAMERVLRSENAYFTHVWDNASRTQRLVLQALTAEPADAITSTEYRQRHGLPAPSSVQKAIETLVADELVAKDSAGVYRIAEPFLAEWILRS